MAVLTPSKAVTGAAATAAMFGLATVAAGTRVLLGADPDYIVFRPLLLFNTGMGVAYIVVGVLAWKRSSLGVPGAALIALLNLMVLAGIGLLYARGGPVAIASLQAMAFRTTVWVVIFLVLRWARGQASPRGPDAA